MRSSSVASFLALFVLGVHAHFQLQFPPPRGPFVEDDEPNFCDGYNSVTTNRTQFPLSGGFFSLNSEHPKWTAGVLISTVANPASFNNFSLVNNFFQVNGEGPFCIPLDFSTSNVTGLTNGQNVTLQVVFDGGDGNLYQCADITLESNFSISSSVSCTNATSSGGSSTAPSGTSTAPATGSPTTGAGFYQASASSMTVCLGLLTAALVSLI